MSKALHRQFKSHMKKMGYTTRYIADVCGVSSAYISNVLNNRTATFAPDRLAQVHDQMEHIIQQDYLAVAGCVE